MKIWELNDIVTPIDYNRLERITAGVGVVVLASNSNIYFSTENLIELVEGQQLIIRAINDLSNPKITIYDQTNGVALCTDVIISGPNSDLFIPQNYVIPIFYNKSDNVFKISNPTVLATDQDIIDGTKPYMVSAVALKTILDAQVKILQDQINIISSTSATKQEIQGLQDQITILEERLNEVLALPIQELINKVDQLATQVSNLQLLIEKFSDSLLYVVIDVNDIPNLTELLLKSDNDVGQYHAPVTFGGTPDDTKAWILQIQARRYTEITTPPDDTPTDPRTFATNEAYLTAIQIDDTSKKYERFCFNDVWGEWQEVKTGSSSAVFGVNAMILFASTTTPSDTILGFFGGLDVLKNIMTQWKAQEQVFLYIGGSSSSDPSPVKVLATAISVTEDVDNNTNTLVIGCYIGATVYAIDITLTNDVATAEVQAMQLGGSSSPLKFKRVEQIPMGLDTTATKQKIIEGFGGTAMMIDLFKAVRDEPETMFYIPRAQAFILGLGGILDCNFVGEFYTFVTTMTASDLPIRHLGITYQVTYNDTEILTARVVKTYGYPNFTYDVNFVPVTADNPAVVNGDPVKGRIEYDTSNGTNIGLILELQGSYLSTGKLSQIALVSEPLNVGYLQVSSITEPYMALGWIEDYSTSTVDTYLPICVPLIVSFNATNKTFTIINKQSQAGYPNTGSEVNTKMTVMLKVNLQQ